MTWLWSISKFIDSVTGKITHFAIPKDPKSYNDNFEAYTQDKLNILDELFSEKDSPA
nr:hypothetical protein [Bacillus sp. USDA818B3_A]